VVLEDVLAAELIIQCDSYYVTKSRGLRVADPAKSRFPSSNPRVSCIMSHDEFEHYDFSEFTEEELARFDIDNTKIPLQKVSPISESQQDISAGHRVVGLSSFGGGPALDIAIESPINKIPKPTVTMRISHLSASTKPLQLTSPRNQTRNLYEKFLSWRNAFSVTDLVSPIWLVHKSFTHPSLTLGYRCEVQYEYGLYGERHKPLERRPSSFTSQGGKKIQIKQNVAQQNDKTLKRGAVCLIVCSFRRRNDLLL